jgi:hypothetical protein
MIQKDKDKAYIKHKIRIAMANIKVIIAYDGTNYHGFQEQRGTGFMTVQSVFEERLSRLAKRDIRVIGAGRTDAGVHARGQVVNFDSGDMPIPPERIICAEQLASSRYCCRGVASGSGIISFPLFGGS